MIGHVPSCHDWAITAVGMLVAGDVSNDCLQLLQAHYWTGLLNMAY